MNLTLQFKDYLLALQSESNRPLSLAAVLAPFGIHDAPTALDNSLLVGHILDALASEYLEVESIDAIDVIRMADDLGSDVTGPLGNLLAA